MTFSHNVLKAALLSGVALGVAALPTGGALAESCLLDTNNNGVADATVDTDGGAEGGTIDTRLACGVGATSGGAGTSIGGSSSAGGDYSTAVGYFARANGTYATAIGSSANASNVDAIAIGTEAQASGEGATSLGSGSQATGVFSLALGRTTRASA